MSNNSKRKRCPSCAEVKWWKDAADVCIPCYNHHDYHVTYDPRCPLCIVQRIKALVKALVIMIRQMLLPRGD